MKYFTETGFLIRQYYNASGHPYQNEQEGYYDQSRGHSQGKRLRYLA